MSFLGKLLYWHFLLLPLFTFLFCHPCFSLPGNTTDQHALLSFKNALKSDPLQLTSSWNESTHFCEWVGITCGRKHQRVVKINLTSSKLQGSLSPAIGNLSFLRLILLNHNSFSGKIPDEIGELSRLRILQLGNNSFSGEITNNISRCSHLIFVDLGINNLTGRLPVEFQSLSKLQVLNVERNKLTGEIPPHYGNLSSLYGLSMNDNTIQGVIPNSFGRLKNLAYFQLCSNLLISGTIPISISNLSSLVQFDVQNNQLEGQLPQNMSDTIEFFSVGNNHFIGHLPLWVSNVPTIQVLQLHTNNFTGDVPNFGGLNSLQKLFLSENKHLGSGDLRFMAPLTNCTRLQFLYLDQCNIGGKFPPYIGNISNLTMFGIRYNHITGKIPIEIGQLVDLEQLWMEGNLLSGTIPNTMGKLSHLYSLRLGLNKLSGEIPGSLGNLTMLSDLSLASNNLEGFIPFGLAKCKFLLRMDLYENNLSGSIPKELFYLGSGIVHLDFSHNTLTGPLPFEIGGLKSLMFLNLSNNHFFGEIPPRYSSLESVETLDLSSNHLTGKMPSFLANLRSLLYLNLSYNDLEGEVPIQGIFKRKNGVFLGGNNKLCGGVVLLHLPKCSIKKRSSLGLKIGISIPCVVLALLLVSFFICNYLQRKRVKNASLESPTTLDGIPMVSYKSLHNATKSFAQENLIGTGKFSSVYKGNLDEQRDNNVVAIKVLKLHVKGASKSFIDECDALRHTRHRNLVKVVSSCSSIDYHGNDFKAIIYEYMEEGNLETWLHHHSKENDQNCGRTHYLSLLERLNIGIDIACALDYLHAECGTPLVHCNLKPSNVLLDRDLVAHVSDFGLARFLPEAAHTNSMGIKGTFGYAAPEYGMGSEFSTFGDMYSYGILLLEMFTGKSPTDDAYINGLNLHEYVKIAIPHKVKEIVDPTLICKEDTSIDSTQISHDRVLEILVLIFEVGIACSVDSPRERMNAYTALNKLHAVKASLNVRRC